MRTNKQEFMAGKVNPMYLIVLLLACLVGQLQAFGDGIIVPGGGSTSNVGGSTCTFSASGLDTCIIGSVTPAAGSFSSLNGVAVSATTGNTNLVFSATPTIASPNITGNLTLSAGAGWGVSSHKAFINTAPTVSSGFGTSPTIVQATGSASFSVNVGTGGSATSGVIAIGTASNEWNCQVSSFNPSSAQLLNTTIISARTTTSITLTNEVTSTGVAAAWPASQVLMINCFGA